jgi:TetR/AcrR family transcriptional regulator of autoinduction and epiphytic fitness
VGETHVTDRRIERANRTRDNIVDALLALIEAGNFRPTAREIAAQANVSLRSLYVHFDDVEALFHAAAIRHRGRLDEVCTELVASGPFEDRLAAFLTRRIGLYEAGSNVRRAALLQEPFSPALHSILEQAREAGRAELDKVFGPELTGRKTDPKRAALDVITNPDTWHALRIHHGLGLNAARGVVSDLVRALLGQDRNPVEEGSPKANRPTAKRGT